ncbi:transposase [Fusobacterium polymorphum]|uniref:transposase n=1 Tax=Fusobacterium nucleatum subsp. polymorphum TaxID=76857 RepID=UPI00300B04F7
MIKAINNNRYFKFFQPKLFYINQDINNDDPVRLLSAILEEMDFSNLLQVFPNKTKVHPVNMFAVIIYAYSRGIYSTRDIEYLCKDSQRAQYLLNSSNIPDYSAIARFLSKANNIIYELFCQFVEKLLKLSEITTETIYIDGTKIEAYANKYSFFWKKSTLKYKERLEENILQLIEEFNKYFNKELDSIFDILSFLEELKIHKIYGRGKRKSKEQLFLEKIKSQNIEVKNVVADADYESLSNYEYLKINSYVSYIKPIYYEKSKTRKYKKDLNRVENLEYNEEENRLFRKDGLELKFLYYGKDKKTIYFRNPETEKKVRYNYKFRKLSKESKDNIESEFGKQLRMNRSIQVEGAFAVLKEDMKLRKLKVRGKESAKREIGLFCIAYNFNRYLAKLVRKKQGVILHPLKIA